MRRTLSAGFIGSCGAVLLLALGTRDTVAQARSTAGGPGSYLSAGGGVSAFQEDYGQQVIGGAVVWIDANVTWRYGLEAEARWLNYHTNEQVTETTYLGGVRVMLWKPGSRFQPYGKFLAGNGRFNFPFNYETGNYLAMAPGAGLDIHLNDRWSIRAADFEYQLWPQFTYGQLKPYGVSVGLRYRINGVDQFPKNAGRHTR
jgi:Outer membrane protein beta-barrel domain